MLFANQAIQYPIQLPSGSKEYMSQTTILRVPGSISQKRPPIEQVIPPEGLNSPIENAVRNWGWVRMSLLCDCMRQIMQSEGIEGHEKLMFPTSLLTAFGPLMQCPAEWRSTHEVRYHYLRIDRASGLVTKEGCCFWEKEIPVLADKNDDFLVPAGWSIDTQDLFGRGVRHFEVMSQQILACFEDDNLQFMVEKGNNWRPYGAKFERSFLAARLTACRK